MASRRRPCQRFAFAVDASGTAPGIVAGRARGWDFRCRCFGSYADLIHLLGGRVGGPSERVRADRKPGVGSRADGQ